MCLYRTMTDESYISTVGGTSGIGETTAREFVRHTLEPRVYLVGRNQTEASRIIDELAKLNPDGKVRFVQTDASLLRSVDEACDKIKEQEEKINLLFLSPGIMTTKGRQGTYGDQNLPDASFI